jgi:hypothetical protein
MRRLGIACVYQVLTCVKLCPYPSEREQLAALSSYFVRATLCSPRAAIFTAPVVVVIASLVVDPPSPAHRLRAIGRKLIALGQSYATRHFLVHPALREVHMHCNFLSLEIFARTGGRLSYERLSSNSGALGYGLSRGRSCSMSCVLSAVAQCGCVR